MGEYYITVWGKTIENMQSKANQKVGVGYIPVGRPFIDDYTWIQALYKPKVEDYVNTGPG